MSAIAKQIVALMDRIAALEAALEPFAKLNAMDPPESVPLNEWLPLVTGARAALKDGSPPPPAEPSRDAQDGERS